MKIGIDIQALQTNNSKNRGIGRYVRSTLAALIAEPNHHEYQLYANKNLSEPEIDRYCFPYSYINYPEIGSCELNNLLLKTTLTAANIEGVFIPSPMEGSDSTIPNFRDFNKKTYVICYDLIPLLFSDRYLTDPNYRALYMQRLENIRNADFVFAISESTRQDTISYLHKSPDRVLNISGGISGFFTPIPKEEHHTWQDTFARKFKLDKKFILYTGGEDWRKNIEGLIKAFARLPLNLKQSYQLVIACKISDIFASKITQLAIELGVERCLVLTSYITDLELRALYSTCSLFVFPSFYEGFGLPLLEAMACGAPAIASNNSSLPEILGTTEYLFDPHSPEDMARAIQKVLSDENLQQRLATQSIARAGEFSWKSVASKISDVFSEQQSLSRFSILFNRVKAADPKTQLALFSPFKPAKSGIADYTYDLLPSLSQHFEIHSYYDEDATPDPNATQNLVLASHFESDLLDREYECILYQMGNSSYHCYMYSLLMRYSGISVLHDYALGGLINYMDGHCPHLGITLLTELEHSYGKNKALEIINLLQQGKLNLAVDLPASEFYINRRIFTRSLGVILHSKWAYNAAIDNYSHDNNSIGWIPQVVPQYVSDNDPVVDIRNEFNIPVNSVVIATFGFVSSTKRPVSILHAFHQYCLEYPTAFLLFVGGTEYLGSVAIEELIQKLGLQERVKITGYVEMRDFYRYIEAADICLNLRFPFNGESSASLLRILSVGKPTVVTDIGSFSDFPDDVVVKIPQPDRCDEVVEIVKALRVLTENVEYRNSLSERAATYVSEEHSPQRCANLYADFIKQVLRSPEAKQKMLADYVGRESAKLKISDPSLILSQFSQIIEQRY